LAQAFVAQAPTCSLAQPRIHMDRRTSPGAAASGTSPTHGALPPIPHSPSHAAGGCVSAQVLLGRLHLHRISGPSSPRRHRCEAAAASIEHPRLPHDRPRGLLSVCGEGLFDAPPSCLQPPPRPSPPAGGFRNLGLLLRNACGVGLDGAPPPPLEERRLLPAANVPAMTLLGGGEHSGAEHFADSGTAAVCSITGVSAAAALAGAAPAAMVEGVAALVAAGPAMAVTAAAAVDAVRVAPDGMAAAPADAPPPYSTPLPGVASAEDEVHNAPRRLWEVSEAGAGLFVCRTEAAPPALAEPLPSASGPSSPKGALFALLDIPHPARSSSSSADAVMASPSFTDKSSSGGEENKGATCSNFVVTAADDCVESLADEDAQPQLLPPGGGGAFRFPPPPGVAWEHSVRTPSSGVGSSGAAVVAAAASPCPARDEERPAPLMRSPRRAATWGRHPPPSLDAVPMSDGRATGVGERPKASRTPAKGELADEDIVDFLRQFFADYSSPVNGRQLMNGPDLARFFRDFAAGSVFAPTPSRQACLYGEELELQQDTRFRFDLSRTESAKGLCFETFQVLLSKAMPAGVAHSLAKQKFLEYAGSASSHQDSVTAS